MGSITVGGTDSVVADDDDDDDGNMDDDVDDVDDVAGNVDDIVVVPMGTFSAFSCLTREKSFVIVLMLHIFWVPSFACSGVLFVVLAALFESLLFNNKLFFI